MLKNVFAMAIYGLNTTSKIVIILQKPLFPFARPPPPPPLLIRFINVYISQARRGGVRHIESGISDLL